MLVNNEKHEKCTTHGGRPRPLLPVQLGPKYQMGIDMCSHVHQNMHLNLQV